VSSAGVDHLAFIADVNDKVRRRGFVLWDGQVLTTPLDTSEMMDVIFESDSADATFEVPPRREWQSAQHLFFGLENPYQMAEEADEYTWSHVMTRVIEPYLSPDERIAALLHGEQDGSYFYCPCHFGSVVYTTRHRLVCMSCGATHVVLRDPLAVIPRQFLSAEEWVQLFDEDGSRRDEEIELSLIDFRDVEHAETVWVTDQWDESRHEFVFFARSSPEEIEEAIRGTERDPSIFLEAGWSPVEMAPPPAHQVMDGSVEVDFVENSAHAFCEGVSSFLAAYDRSERLVNAIPQLFRSIELLLKARLQELDPHALDDQPNNPMVLKRLEKGGVSISADDAATVARLRRLRNDLQHGTARFNHRAGLALCKRAIVFVDRFVHSQLGLWVGDVVPVRDWQKLLGIPDIATTAGQIADHRLDEFRCRPEASINVCPRCEKQTLLRPHPRTGAACVFCSHVPVYEDQVDG